MIFFMPLARGGVLYPYDFFTHSKRFKKATTTTTTTRGGGDDDDDDARVFYRVLPMMLSRVSFVLSLSFVACNFCDEVTKTRGKYKHLHFISRFHGAKQKGKSCR